MSLSEVEIRELDNILYIAEACHEANRAYCKTIGDFSQKKWELCPDWQKESAIKGVLHLIDNPDAKPEDSHKSWLKVKEEDGWSYGEIKDVNKKEHPCYVPYDELPEYQKKKDLVFSTLAKMLI